MIPDWQTNTIYFADTLPKKYPDTYARIVDILAPINPPLLINKTKDIWARDYMPIQINDEDFIEYRYDPDYLQGDTDDEETRELKSYPNIICDALNLNTIKSDIILDGGNIVKSENVIILTDKIVWENERNYTEKELLHNLHETFQVEQVILIPWDEACEFGHADGMLRFIDNETVLLSGFYETIDVGFRKHLVQSIEKAKLNIEWLRCAKKEKEANIAYINFLQTKDLILVPELNRKDDDLAAFESISAHYKTYAENNRIFQVDVRDIAKQSGALNCISWTRKD